MFKQFRDYVKIKNEDCVNMSLLVDCTNSLLLVLNYIAVNICVNTFLEQRNNCQYFLLIGNDTWWSLMMF
jgi:hypothetical protein